MKTLIVIIALFMSVIVNAQVFPAKDFYYIDQTGKVPATSGWPITKLGFFDEGISMHGEFGVRYLDSKDLKVVRSIGIPEWESPSIWFIVFEGEELKLRVMVTKDKNKNIIPIRAIFVGSTFLSVMEF